MTATEIIESLNYEQRIIHDLWRLKDIQLYDKYKSGDIRFEEYLIEHELQNKHFNSLIFK